MYFVIAGGGEVGFHLAKALLESSHEVMLLESDRRRAQVIEEKLGSVVLNAPADEGRYQLEAGCQRADAVIAVTGEDPANLIICQLAKWKCNVPRVIARVNDPKNEIVFKALGIDETISSRRRSQRERPRRANRSAHWVCRTARRSAASCAKAPSCTPTTRRSCKSAIGSSCSRPRRSRPTCGRRSSARPRRGRPGRRWPGGTARRRRPCSA
ncbi:MAG: TrkA family potassium uptake protein [Chloroflexi bacterium]|nr:MAG: TrkA family potassium uptake protein [Chloroflexota bacterium]